MGKKSDPNKAAIKLQREQMKRLNQIGLPQLEEFILQSPELVGLLEAEELEDSDLKKIQEDPRLREAQMQALQQMQQLGEVGLTPEERAQRSEILRQGEAQEQARQKQILQGMAQRGSLDSGASLLAQLQSSAAAGADARRQSEQMAADVASRRRQALQQAGNAATTMSAEQFRRQAASAQAQDAVNRFNAAQRANVNQMNLAARQGIENQRTSIANQQAQVANMIAQQRYQNELSRATGQGQVTNAMSTLTANQAQQPGWFQSGLAGAATGAGIGSMFAGATKGSTLGPWGAAAGAGLGVLSSMFEDGGVVHAKDGYPKEGMTSRYRNPIMSYDNEGVPELNNMSSEEFQDAVLKQEQEEQQAKAQAKKEAEERAEADRLMKEEMDRVNNMFKEAGKSKEGLKAALEKGKAITPGINADIDTPLQTVRDVKIAQRNIKEDSPVMAKGEEVADKKFNAKGLAAALEGVNKMFGEKPERQQISLPSFSPIQVQNAMKQMGNVDFSNAFRAENGGLYQGTNYAEDGTVMFDSNGEGAIVGGDSYERDRIDARLNSGEAVLNAAQQQRLLDLLRGKESVESLGEEDIVEGVPKGYHDELKSDVDKKRDIKQKGLERLLKTLGE